MNKNLICLEFNELCDNLMAEFIDSGELPNFERFKNASIVYTTDAEANGSALNPWVQWVTVHTGISHDTHGVARLNEGEKAAGSFIWDKLSRDGLSSWICGSMNTSYQSDFKGNLLPDPWAESIRPYPPGKFDAYHDYVSQSVIGHSSDSKVSPYSFIAFLLKSRVRLDTIYKLVCQLVHERINPEIKWKRASLLDLIQYDIFRNVFVKDSPNFSTFFLNSTAHYQHHYWAEMRKLNDSSTVHKSKRGVGTSILHGYKTMDNILGKAMQLAKEKNADILFCTGLSQVEYVASEEGQRHYYRIHSFDKLVEKFDCCKSAQYSPVMAEQFHLSFSSESEAEKCAEFLKAVEMEDNSAFHAGSSSNSVFLITTKGNKVYAQCACTKRVKQGARYVIRKTGEVCDFGEMFYRMPDVKSGKHDPLGMLWIYEAGKSHEIINEPVKLEFVTNYITNYFDRPVTADKAA